MKWLQNKKRNGYTLVEMVMALAAFTIVMLGITQIFARSIASYREVRLTQANLEAAQSSFNLIAKELRTSSVVASNPGATTSTIKFFDYSQNMCIEYAFNESTGQITKRSMAYADPDLAVNVFDEQWNYCSGVSLAGTGQVLLTGLTSQTLQVVSSTAPTIDPTVGKVTLSVTVGQGNNANTLQTTVSLRDFNFTAY